MKTKNNSASALGFLIKDCAKCENNIRCEECAFNKGNVEILLQKAVKETAQNILREIEELAKNTYGGYKFETLKLDGDDLVCTICATVKRAVKKMGIEIEK